MEFNNKINFNVMKNEKSKNTCKKNNRSDLIDLNKVKTKLSKNPKIL